MNGDVTIASARHFEAGPWKTLHTPRDPTIFDA